MTREEALERIQENVKNTLEQLSHHQEISLDQNEMAIVNVTLEGLTVSLRKEFNHQHKQDVIQISIFVSDEDDLATRNISVFRNATLMIG